MWIYQQKKKKIVPTQSAYNIIIVAEVHGPREHIIQTFSLLF